MFNFKRLTIVCGHYGTGKTNIALNLAFYLKSQGVNTAIADLDIVNPYFRTKDSEEILKSSGIRLICSEYANSNLDIPALPDDLYSITDDKNQSVILDIGGDDRGAFVLGRLRDKILEENNYEMVFAVNKYRPLTSDAAQTAEIMAEIENAAGIRFTGIINNSNLGEETAPGDVMDSLEYAGQLQKMTGIKVLMTTVENRLYESLAGKINDLFPIKLQEKII